MAGQPLEEQRRRELARSIAADLRAVVAALSDRAISDDDLAAAAALSRELRERVDGPRRPRWYDGDATALDDSDRFAYLDQSPIRGRLNPIAPPMKIDIALRDDGTRRAIGHARLSSAYEGPPHGVHGGWVAALFDELLGTAQGLGETKGVTAMLKVRYRAVTPIDEDLRFEGWIHEVRGRRTVIRGTCHAGEALTADAEGVFIQVDFNEIQARMRARGSDGD
jgi:acyl-coenzyme A thioesterase PaaI-like protein